MAGLECRVQIGNGNLDAFSQALRPVVGFREVGAPKESLVNWRDHMTVDPEVCHGRACIAGTRVLVTTVLDNLAAGLDAEAIVSSYPSINRESVRAAVSYAAELAKERVVAWSA